MGIDISQLSPAAQKQALEKLMELEKKKLLAQQKPEQKANKYRNQPTERVTEDGKQLKFDSKKEAERFDELMLMLKAGEIRNLRLQQNFTLQEAYTLPSGERVRSIIYKADFCYERKVEIEIQVDGGCVYETYQEWQKVVEDVKSSATKTKVYAMKKKLMQEKFGIAVKEV